MKLNRNKSITIRVTAKMERELRKLAADDRRTLADYVRLMIEDRLREEKERRELEE